MITNELAPINDSKLIAVEIQPLDQNPAAVYLAGLGNDKSRRVQKQGLEIIANMLTGSPDILAVQWGELRFQHTAAVRSRLAAAYSIATTNRILCALRRTLKAAWKLEQMTADERNKACDLDPVNGETLPAGRALTAGEISALMSVCERDLSPAGARDAAMIACMYPGGLRRDEVINLDLSDYNPDNGELTVRHGKNNKARIAHMTNGAIYALDDWFAVRGSEPGPMLYPINKAGIHTQRRMTNQAVYNALIKRGNQAGVKDLSPHDLRRTFITDLLEAGADLSIVADMAGHKRIDTTRRYDRRPEAAKAKAAGLLHLPYRGRKVI